MGGAEAPGPYGGRAEASALRQKFDYGGLDSAGMDSVAVEIPITQREYEGAEYRAWVSGYEPRLDSIFVFGRRDVVTIREPPNKPKRWGVGVFAGYGLTRHGPEPCVGISINYNLWSF